jgi:hypothetical protein
MVMSRRQAAEALVIRLMSASIAAMAVITAVRAVLNPRMATETGDPLACLESLVDEGSGERARQPDPEHDCETTDLVFQGHPLANQLLARDDQRAERMSFQLLHMHWLEEPGTSQMRQPSRVIAIGLVSGERLERLVGLSAFDADHGKAQLPQPVEQDGRHASRSVSSSTSWPIVSAFAEELPPITRC